MIDLMISYGTRPELIKLAPVYFEARASVNFQVNLVSTGQHEELAKQAEQLFDIEPQYNLQTMSEGQSLSSLLSKIICGADRILQKLSPHCVIVQGDTTSALGLAIAAFNNNVKIGHVEAGLRSHDKRNPFPEETNRVLISELADFHFAPTQNAKLNLIRKGFDENNIFVVGNTIVDAMNLIKVETANLSNRIMSDHQRMILVTLHRRENIGRKLGHICDALVEIAKSFSNIQIVFPVHPNPQVREIVFKKLNHIKNISLIEPVDYPTILEFMDVASLVITDSGGIQEEAPSFNLPVLICRETTERPEILEHGLGKLVGSDPEMILASAREWLVHPPKGLDDSNPFGDGHAAKKIIKILGEHI